MKTLVFLSVVFCLLLAGSAQAEKIDINTAPLEELTKIIHIGETRARELIASRPFSSLDELTKIKGIGEARVGDIKEQGLAWVAEPEKPKPKLAENGSPQALQNNIEMSPIEIELSKSSNGSPIFLAAIFTAFSGGVMILILKEKIKI